MTLACLARRPIRACGLALAGSRQIHSHCKAVSGPSLAKRCVTAQGVGKDAFQGWIDVSHLVSGGGKTKTAYDKLASLIGERSHQICSQYIRVSLSCPVPPCAEQSNYSSAAIFAACALAAQAFLQLASTTSPVCMQARMCMWTSMAGISFCATSQ